MSVRKREWTNATGQQTRCWLVDYRDVAGVRRTRQFKLKKQADAFSHKAAEEVSQGIHIVDSATVSVSAAATAWITTGIAAGLERATIDQRIQHVEKHITPFIGAMKISRLTIPVVRAFQDKLRAESRSPTLVKKVTTSLGGILRDAAERGLVARNPVSEMRGVRGTTRKRRLEAGVDIPLPTEIGRLIATLATMPKWRPLLMTVIFTGMRASELRGLRWIDVELDRSLVHVRQRADRYKTIDRPKSTAGTRTIPIPPLVTNTLREWQLRCPRGTLGLVFPDRRGGILSHSALNGSALMPACRRAGLLDGEGRPKYSAHSLRHFYASWLINRKVDGGLELPPKTVQTRLGHSSIVMTLDTYGHLFPAADDDGQLADAAARLIGS